MPGRKVDIFGRGKGSLASRLLERRKRMETGDVAGAAKAARPKRRTNPAKSANRFKAKRR